MICTLVILLLSGEMESRDLVVKQILERDEEQLKIVYDLPKDSLPHYLNRGIVRVDASRCSESIEIEELR